MKEPETIVVNGEEYVYNEHYTRLRATLNSDCIENPIHVLCAKCLGNTFTLRYGEWEIIADCDCGHSMVVYDG